MIGTAEKASVTYIQSQPCTHNHAHSCAHLNVKYCAVCGKTYCVDCGQTWSKDWYNYYPTGGISWNPQWMGNISVSNNTPVNNGNNELPNQPCGHGT